MTGPARFRRIRRQKIRRIRATPENTSRLTIAIPTVTPGLNVGLLFAFAADGDAGTLVPGGVSVPGEVTELMLVVGFMVGP